MATHISTLFVWQLVILSVCVEADLTVYPAHIDKSLDYSLLRSKYSFVFVFTGDSTATP